MQCNPMEGKQLCTFKVKYSTYTSSLRGFRPTLGKSHTKVGTAPPAALGRLGTILWPEHAQVS